MSPDAHIWHTAKALEEHDGKVSIGGRNITNLWFADDKDALAEEEQELEVLVESLDKTCTRYKMEISAELKPIWRDNNISLVSMVKLMRSHVISIFLYASESWTFTAELEKRPQALEMRCYRRLLNISYKDHVTNEEVRRKIQAAVGEYDELLTLVKKRKLRWFGHVSRSSGLAKTILQGIVKGKKKKRQTEEEVGRQYQRVDRNGLCQLN